MRPDRFLLFAALAACSSETDTGEGDILIDGILRHDVSAVTWADAVDNPTFPLPVGATWDYTATTPDGLETDHVEVLADTREIEGVTATVVYDLVALDGETIEETWDWYAQDTDGNVWYLGEDTCEFEGGECVAHVGAWEWGVDGALPGILMPAAPAADGQPYFQEYAEGVAEDVGEVIATGETAEAAGQSWTDCIRTADTSHIDPDLYEEKVYCPGVGNVLVVEGDVVVTLESMTAS